MQNLTPRPLSRLDRGLYNGYPRTPYTFDRFRDSFCRSSFRFDPNSRKSTSTCGAAARCRFLSAVGRLHGSARHGLRSGCSLACAELTLASVPKAKTTTAGSSSVWPSLEHGLRHGGRLRIRHSTAVRGVSCTKRTGISSTSRHRGVSATGALCRRRDACRSMLRTQGNEFNRQHAPCNAGPWQTGAHASQKLVAVELQSVAMTERKILHIRYNSVHRIERGMSGGEPDRRQRRDRPSARPGRLRWHMGAVRHCSADCCRCCSDWSDRPLRQTRATVIRGCRPVSLPRALAGTSCEGAWFRGRPANPLHACHGRSAVPWVPNSPG